jgi:succinyl-diaminopimelate desuccinylase
VNLESFLDSAAGLLAIESTAQRPDMLRAALDFVLGFAGPGFTAERFQSGGKPSALVYPERGGAAGGRPEFGVILNGHLDVVPAPPDQFRPVRAGQRLYARGAQDMKVSGLVLTLVFRELARDLPYPLGLQLVTDDGIDAVSFGAGGEGQHGPREYADIATIVPCYEALAGFLTGISPNDPG